MVTKYLLRCSCGRKFSVEARQAGEQITCRCGARLEVPTLRALAALDQVHEHPAASRWSHAQGAMFIFGLVWVATGVAATVWLASQAQRSYAGAAFDLQAEQYTARLDDLSPVESLALWQMFRDYEGAMLTGPERLQAAKASQARWFWLAVGAGVTSVAGVGWLAWVILGARRVRR